MSAHNRAVEDAVFHVGVISEVLKHALPDTLVAPAGEAFVDTIPVAILGWEEAPLGSAPVDPEHGFEKAAAGSLIASVGMRVGAQKGVQFGPDGVIQLYSCHTTTVPY
jgi:hypothetical protein